MSSKMEVDPSAQVSGQLQSVSPSTWPDETSILNALQALFEGQGQAKHKLWDLELKKRGVETIGDLRAVDDQLFPTLSENLVLLSGLNKLRQQAPPPSLSAQGLDVGKGLTALVKNGNQKVDAHLIQRILKREYARASAIVHNSDKKAALDIYEQFEQMPRTDTEIQFKLKGIQLDGNLIINNENIMLCFKGTVPSVLKVLDIRETERFEALKEKQISHDHIVEFSLMTHDSVKRNAKSTFAIMPLLPTTLEHLDTLLEETPNLLWKQMSSALRYLHDNKFAHMDIKPANIAINSKGEFVLIDLGSTTTFGKTTESTPAYVPHGFTVGKASADVDWWMLAATLSDKSPHRKSSHWNLQWGTGSRNTNMDELVQFLSAYHSSIHGSLVQIGLVTMD